MKLTIKTVSKNRRHAVHRQRSLTIFYTKDAIDLHNRNSLIVMLLTFHFKQKLAQKLQLYNAY